MRCHLALILFFVLCLCPSQTIAFDSFHHETSDDKSGSELEFGPSRNRYNVGEVRARRAPGFMFSIPKTLVEGKNETICVSLHDAAVPARTIINLKLKDQHFFTEKMIHNLHECLELYVPDMGGLKEAQYVGVRVHMHMNSGIYSSHNQDPILIYPRSHKYVTFIETDRPIYKPNDHVNFRILCLTTDLLPPSDYTIREVKIRNPLDVSVDVWENVPAELGMVQLEYHLPNEAIVGKWKIEANNEVRTFEVSKYVIPRFGVTIVNPKVIYYENPWAVFKVCSNYSFGQAVKGTAFIKLTDTHNNMQPVIRLKQLTNGCANFVFKQTTLYLDRLKEKFSLSDPKIHILITATVTELGTDRIEVATAKSLVYLKPYGMRFLTDNIFQPGLPYRGKLQLYYVNKDVSHEVIEICYNIAVRRSWNYLNNEQCRNFTVDSDQSIHFQILPLKNNVIHMHLNARSLNHSSIGDSFLLVRLFSPSNSYIHLDQNYMDHAKCKMSQHFTVQYTADNFVDGDNITFYYMIKSRGQLIMMSQIVHTVKKHYVNYEDEFQHIVGMSHKFLKTNTGIDKFSLKFRLNEQVVSKYQLLVYYVTNTGEVVSTSKNVDIEPCLRNKVKAKWSHDKLSPGERATLNIKTSSPSLCAVSVVDSSIKFLGLYQSLHVNSLLKRFTQERDAAPSNRKPCIPPIKRRSQASSLIMENDSWDSIIRRKRFVYSFSEDFDAYDTFNKFGTTTISNLKIITKYCYTGPSVSQNNGVQFLTDYYEPQSQDTIVPIRSYFPETWLWELVPVKNYESVNIHRDIPHTITSWMTNVMCLSNSEGVGFSETPEIVSFQPFFIDALAPYSIKRGEYLYLNVIIFNYLSYSIPISVSLGQSNGLRLIETSHSRSATYCVRANETVNHMLQLLATEIGEMNVTILAEVDSVYPGLCGPDVLLSKRDVVFKKIFVEPEGYPLLITKSALLCSSDLSEISNVTWDLKIPDDVIPDTAKTTVTVNGDLLGPALNNLGDLITMPTGCGEQIMASMAPNVYVLRYLNATNNLTPLMRQKTLRNVKIGYQAILNYVHKDGSFSAFGYHDPMGSMFLTAFVVRTLQDAKSYIYVDQRIIDRAVAWIFENQLENGCFNSMLHVFQDMGGTTNENSTAALTAYVMISLYEAGISIPEKVRTNAKYCIRGQNNPDKYTVAISTYALYQVGWHVEGDRLLKRLLDISSTDQSKMWWSSTEAGSSLATDIEITSYALLALLRRNTVENLAYAHSVVRWLVSKLGHHGGFRTTQDTVVGLDALSKYAMLLDTKNLDVEVRIEAVDQFTAIRIRRDDRLKSKTIELTFPNRNVNVVVYGEGCVLAQVVQSYYVNSIPASDSFKLSMDIRSVSNIDECSIATLSPCLAYSGPDQQASMAVLEVTLPSGYEADRSSLYKLLEEHSNSKVKKFEENNNQLVFYFTKVNKEQLCIDFNILENVPVDAKSNSIIKLYDYYKPEFSVSQFYKMKDRCGYNNISFAPEISAKAYDGEINININNNNNNNSKDIMHDIIDYPLSDADTNEDSVGDVTEEEGEQVLSSSAISDLFDRMERMEHDELDVRIKRHTMNPDFVNRDTDMDTPDCGHEFEPEYIRVNESILKH